MPTTRRERMRDATLLEIKEVAREHLRVQGPSGISLRGIARDLGMTAPALYRYYASLDDLLAAMIETYTNEMCDAMEVARDALPADDLGGRLVAVTRAFRSWSLEHRAEFAMVFGAPVPGFTEPEEAGVQRAGGRLGAIFFALFFEIWRRQPFPVPPDEEIPPALRRQLRLFATACRGEDDDAPLGVIRLFAGSWVRLYGLVAIEVFGHMDFMIDDMNPLFEAELNDLAKTIELKKDLP
ncbi:TetR/AcrR family transcriptional regulator [Actinoallomurus iriomotensis]|uniref:TetR family transcriptional regulator n=1 Tax=Actinoallomurus iriomotensis TaxID=478107 RepID=A0A9W6SCU7_9ACTN|nr:TetR/AcrR family transcriptional regulator [Actinoallomurus iriomotensis]GLY90235.1 TetR family transcriptional regulator [Actinoallomurus iriomotensis]